jgi:hypothetical protein
MSDLNGRIEETPIESLIRAVDQLGRSVERLEKNVNGRLDAFEQQVTKRLDDNEHQLDEIGGGLAVVLSRSEDTKKKLPAFPTGFRSWLSVLTSGFGRTKSGSIL